jgi:hypothetical protein
VGGLRRTETAYVVLATNPTNGGAFTYLTIVQAVTSADLEALDHIFATFNVTGA